jgi:hypothetical protein
VPGRLSLNMCLWWKRLPLAHVHIDNFTPTSHLPQLPSADSNAKPDKDNLDLFLYKIPFPHERGGGGFLYNLTPRVFTRKEAQAVFHPSCLSAPKEKNFTS